MEHIKDILPRVIKNIQTRYEEKLKRKEVRKNGENR